MLKSLLIHLANRGRRSGGRKTAATTSSTVLNRRASLDTSDASRPIAAGEPMELPTDAVEPPTVLRQGLTSAGAVTLLLPTVAHRKEFLRSTLDFLSVTMRGVQIVVSDHTEDGNQDAVSKIVGNYKQLDIVVEHHPASMHFLERLVACARVAKTPYVVVHADDDFMLPAAIDESVAFLDRNPDFVGCQGRTFFLKLRAPRSCAPKINRSMTRAEKDAVSRIANQCANFTPTLYALTRREAFIEVNHAALSHTTNVVFWQYLSSCLLLAKGKLRVLDSLYYLRLDNPDGWRATLIREGDKTHWPHLLVAPEFSRELAKLKTGLSTALAGAGAKDIDRIVDDCCLALIRRAFNTVWQHENAELDLLARSSQTDSTENQIIRYCGSLSLAALTRIHG